MTRRIELRPAAERDLVRLKAFIAAQNVLASLRRSKALREALRKLGDAPFAGKPGPGKGLREIVINIGASRYVVRYQVTDEVIIILRIWHGLEDRP